MLLLGKEIGGAGRNIKDEKMNKEIQKVYCDTCIYIDALGTDQNKFKPKTDFAWIFFEAILQGKYILITSDHVL